MFLIFFPKDPLVQSITYSSAKSFCAGLPRGTSYPPATLAMPKNPYPDMDNIFHTQRRMTGELSL
jgi:hypothetical protein